MLRVLVKFSSALVIFSSTLILVFGKNSKFTRTKVIQDTCDKSTKLEEDFVRSDKHCAILCADSSKCRRYRFCVDSGAQRCALFEDGENCVTDLPVNQCQCHRKEYTCDGGVCLCPLGYYGNQCENIITDCSDGHNLGWQALDQRLAYIKPTGISEPFELLCHFNYGGLNHVLLRESSCAPFNFNRTWAEYRQGFGDASTTHWIGLDKFYAMNQERTYQLNLYFGYGPSWSPSQCYYKPVNVLNAAGDFALQISGFYSHHTELCGDSWTNVQPTINNMPFSTFDHDSTSSKCPVSKGNGGWFSTTHSGCSRANIFSNTVEWKENFDGIIINRMYMRLII